jgi:hypothetical protein
MAVVVGAAIALLSSGIVAGAAGDFFVIGQSNDSGASQSVLLNAGTGAAFTLRTTNVSTGAAGIFGWSSSTSANVTRGVYGRADGANSYGVFARQSGAEGDGAALIAEGNLNQGIVATSAEDSAITGTATGCTGFLCGSNGVTGDGAGFAAGVFGSGQGALAGVWGDAGDGIWGTAGFANASGSTAVLGSNSLGNGIAGDGAGAGSFAACAGSGWFCAGGVFRGDNGVMGASSTAAGFGVYGEATGASGWAVYANGNARVTGNLSVGGTCTGCATATVAQNGGSGTISQGDAVTLTGVSSDASGNLVLVVDLARKGDTVLGIADRALVAAPKTVSVKAAERTLKTPHGDKTTKTPARTLASQGAGQLVEGGSSAGSKGYLRVVTAGVYAYKGAALNASVGESLTVGETRGKLAKAGSDAAKGAVAGRYLGTLKDGRLVVLVDNS